TRLCRRRKSPPGWRATLSGRSAGATWCRRRLQDGCFQVGDALVENADVGSGGLQSFLQRPVVRGEFADALVKCGVVGAETPDGVTDVVGFQVADAAQQ